MNNSIERESEGGCDLVGLVSIFSQMSMGLLILLTMICRR